MALNLQALKVVEKQYTRSGGGIPSEQDYSLRLQRSERKGEGGIKTVKSQFIFSDKTFAELGLDNLGLVEVHDPGQNVTAFAVVEEKDANFFKGKVSKEVRQNKTKFMSSDIIETHLIACGVIEDNILGNQFLDLVKAEGSENFVLSNGTVAVGGIYEIVKGDGSVRKFDSAKTETETVNESSTSEVEEVEEVENEDDI